MPAVSSAGIALAILYNILFIYCYLSQQDVKIISEENLLYVKKKKTNKNSILNYLTFN